MSKENSNTFLIFKEFSKTIFLFQTFCLECKRFHCLNYGFLTGETVPSLLALCNVQITFSQTIKMSKKIKSRSSFVNEKSNNFFLSSQIASIHNLPKRDIKLARELTALAFYCKCVRQTNCNKFSLC